MRIEIKSEANTNVVIIPLFKRKIPKLNNNLGRIIKQNKDFAEEFKFNVCYLDNEIIIFAGLGEEKTLSSEKARKFGSRVYNCLKNKEIKEASLVEFSKKADVLQAFAEGFMLTSYAFDKYKKEKDKKVNSLTFVSKNNAAQKAFDFADVICKGIFLTRDLINEIPSVCNPKYMTDIANNVFKGTKVKVKVLEKAELNKLKMGCVLGVAKASEVDPKIVILEYNGKGSKKSRHVLVGKGITYDSGGLNLKPTGYLETMKDDMSGAAAVLGTIKVIADLKLPVNVVGIMGCVENLIGSKSYKPGDVLVSASGKTVEIANTDAEGRLVLSDCLHYAVTHYKPETMIDIATLTGAALVIMGKKYGCIMGNNQQLVDKVLKAGDVCNERSWQLPLWDDFKKDIKSDIADIKNLGNPKGEAGTIAAGIFLQEFVGNTKWVHVDIAGPCWADGSKDYISQGGTGFGVRLLVQHF